MHVGWLLIEFYMRNTSGATKSNQIWSPKSDFHFFVEMWKTIVEYLLFNISSMKKFYQPVFATDLHKQITDLYFKLNERKSFSLW